MRAATFLTIFFLPLTLIAQSAGTYFPTNPALKKTLTWYNNQYVESITDSAFLGGEKYYVISQEFKNNTLKMHLRVSNDTVYHWNEVKQDHQVFFGVNPEVGETIGNGTIKRVGADLKTPQGVLHDLLVVEMNYSNGMSDLRYYQKGLGLVAVENKKGLICYLTSHSGKTSANFTWTLEDAKKQAEKYNELWDTEVPENELDLVEDRGFRLYDTPFPTPEYATTGNGTTGAEFELAGKKILSRSVFIKRGKHSEFLFQDENGKEAVYFSILTIDDGVDSLNPSGASSRNHPNYFAQGSFNTTTKSKVDWVVIQAADGNAYAIVNGRIFDLRAGRVILAAPQQDGSIRFFQMPAGPMTVEQLQIYLKDLMGDQQTIDFFSRKGNI